MAAISYDRATFQGNNTYYVSFDNVQVGKLIGKGVQSCVQAWGVATPKVFTLNGGEDTDPNAVSFAQGYNSVVWGDTTTPEPAGKTNSSGWTLVGDQVTPGWVNATGGTIFQQQFTAHPEINTTIEANDGLANAVITVLKNGDVAAKKIPTTGQDATLQGMENVLQGYQCGSVYKAVYLEAQDAVAIATILRAGQTPPTALVNSTTKPASGTGSSEPASLLTPQWVELDEHGHDRHQGPVRLRHHAVHRGRRQRLLRRGDHPVGTGRHRRHRRTARRCLTPCTGRGP